MAEPICWDAASGGNGHFYHLFTVDAPITWHEAARCAMNSYHSGLPGHLVTVTSAQEDQFIVKNLLADSGQRSAWMGLTDVLREGIMRWITGEPFEFANWSRFPEQQPDNFREAPWHGGEDYGMYSTMLGTKDWAWNDLSVDSIHETVLAYVVEYEPVIPALRDGFLAADVVEWPASNKGNGNFYQLVLSLDSADWPTVRDRARASSFHGVHGDLIALDTPGEFDFVCSQMLHVCGIAENVIGFSGSAAKNTLKWTTGLPVEGLAVKFPNLPAENVYGMLRWHYDHWEVQARDTSVLPDGWFGYIIEYPVGSSRAVRGDD